MALLWRASRCKHVNNMISLNNPIFRRNYFDDLHTRLRKTLFPVVCNGLLSIAWTTFFFGSSSKINFFFSSTLIISINVWFVYYLGGNSIFRVMLLASGKAQHKLIFEWLLLWFIFTTRNLLETFNHLSENFQELTKTLSSIVTSSEPVNCFPFTQKLSWKLSRKSFRVNNDSSHWKH